jgi:hypothetical protein
VIDMLQLFLDFRKDMARVAELAKETLAQDAFSATTLVFRAARRSC